MHHIKMNHTKMNHIKMNLQYERVQATWDSSFIKEGPTYSNKTRYKTRSTTNIIWQGIGVVSGDRHRAL